MGTITLPYHALDNEEKIRETIVEREQQLASTIRLVMPELAHLSDYMLVLNDENQVEKTRDPTSRNRILQLNGLPVSANGSILKEYLLAVFQTKVITMYRSIDNPAWLSEVKRQKRLSYQRVSLKDRTREVKKVQELAVQALYALGLDYGVVKLGVAAGKKYVIQKVIPNPRLNREMEDAFVQAVKRYIDRCSEPKLRLNEIVLGADPEFVMVSSQEKLIMASQFFPVRGLVGCDAIWYRQNRSHKPLVELRPEPTSDPRELVVRIYRALIYAGKKTQRISGKWLAGAMPYEGFPLGGHIHFSGVQPDFKLLRALDNYLSLLLVIVEDERGKGRRPKYGYLGDFRYQDYGGFEYRTPPSWLVSPTLTKGVFALAQLIIANYRTLQFQPLADLALQEAYYKGNKDVIADWLPTLWSDLRACADYDVYKTYLDGFYRYLSSGMTWDETQDIRKNWRLPPYDQKKTM